MIEICEKIINIFEFQAIIRLLLGVILTGIIGYEREAWRKPAGMRTHILVGESAVLIMLCGLFLSEKTGGADPTRIIIIRNRIHWSRNNFKRWISCKRTNNSSKLISSNGNRFISRSRSIYNSYNSDIIRIYNSFIYICCIWFCRKI